MLQLHFVEVISVMKNIVTHLYLGSVLASWMILKSLTETAAIILCSIPLAGQHSHNNQYAHLKMIRFDIKCNADGICYVYTLTAHLSNSPSREHERRTEAIVHIFHEKPLSVSAT